MRIRPATEADLPALAEIFVRSVDDLVRSYRPEQVDALPLDPVERLPTYRHLFRTGSILVADDPHPVAFSAAVVRERVWFLSQLWVLPDRQGAGIGSRLLQAALPDAGDVARSVISSPHPAAQTLYLRAGMYPQWTQIDLGGKATPAAPPSEMRPIGDDDRAWIDALDRDVRGASRPVDHDLFRSAAEGSVVMRDGRALGYVYVWPGGKVGPGATWRTTDMAEVVRAGLARADGEITTAVPNPNWTALRELVGAGCRPAGTSLFMSSRPLGDASRYLSSGGALA